jgi:hypothetical protein
VQIAEGEGVNERKCTGHLQSKLPSSPLSRKKVCGEMHE